MLSVGDTNVGLLRFIVLDISRLWWATGTGSTHMFFAIFLASRAFAPNPGGWFWFKVPFVALPSGA